MIAYNVKINPELLPTIEGEGKNSIVQGGESLGNRAISEGTVVLGSNNFAGLKGYYWNYINLTDKTIYLSTENTEILETEPEIDTTFENPYKVGDVYSFHDGANYYNCGTITTIDHNKVTVDKLPIEEIKVDEPARKYYFYVFGTRDTNFIESTYGVVDFGMGAYVEGEYNFGLHDGVHAEGANNIAYGRYAHVEGFESVSYYNSHAEGRSTTASGENSHSEGYFTIATGHKSHAEGERTKATATGSHAEGYNSEANSEYSHAEGYRTYANGKRSHSEGMSTVANGNYSHVEGNGSVADGLNSHVEGEGSISKNRGEHSEGRYNESNKKSGTYGNGGNTQHSVGIGTSDTDRKNAFEIMQNGDAYLIGVGDYDGTNPTTATRLQDSLGGEPLIEITYSNLKSLRNNSQLVPGKQYRITDYNTTVTGYNYTVGNHQFDIIVVADDVNHLNENARAIQHSGDIYFSNCKLEAWEIKYCLDNDTNRFEWANTTNGKGVIYWMRDEFNNECPYDFKNVKFYRKWNSDKSLWSTIAISSESDAKPCYTFSSNGTSSTTSFTDMSLSANNHTHSNVIKEYIDSKKQKLNNNCFFGTNICSNTIGYNSCNNSIGNYFNNNSIGNGFSYNSIGNEVYDNFIGNDFNSNSIGNYFRYNSIGNNFYNNSIESSFYCNSIGNDFKNNSIRNYFQYNSIGNYFQYNSIGNYFQYNSIGSYIRQCTINEGVKYINLIGGTSPSDYVQNCHIYNGTQGVSNIDKLEITFEKNKKYTQFAALNGDNNLVIRTF